MADEKRKFCGSISVRIGTRRVASAVATQEATDDDSNWLRKQPVNEIAVAIRKARRLANDWRKLELSPAPLHGGPEGFYRVRQARRWVDAPDGKPRFFDAAGIARFTAQTALCGLETPASAPEIPFPSRVSAKRPDGFYEGTWTNTEPILDYGGRWMVNVTLDGKRQFVPVEDIIVRKERHRGK